MKQDKAHPSSTPDTMWTDVIVPATQGSVKSLGDLFTMYEAAICNLIRQTRKGLDEDQVKDLFQKFAMTCIRRDFLRRVDRTKGRFRHFLWVCVRRFLMDEGERTPVPGNRDDVPIDVGSEEEYSLQVPAETSEEWFVLDEPWALAIEASALNKVEGHISRRGLPKEYRDSLIQRLRAQQDPDTTLKDDARRLKVREIDYNNSFYTCRLIFREQARKEIESQVRSNELQDEFDHFLRVLARVRRESKHTEP